MSRVQVVLGVLVASLVTCCCFYTASQKPASWPVSYEISNSVPSDWRTPIQKAGNSWGVMNYGGLGGQGVVADGVRTVGLNSSLPAGVLAAALPQIVNGCTITEQDIGFHPQRPWSTSSTTPSGTYDVETVALHEFGHWWTLWHVMCPEESVMLATYQDTRRSLAGCDTLGGVVSGATVGSCLTTTAGCFGLGSLFGLFGFGDTLDSYELDIVNHGEELMQIVQGDASLSSTLDQLAASAPPAGESPEVADVSLAITAVSQARSSASPSLQAALDEVDLLITNYFNSLISGTAF